MHGKKFLFILTIQGTFKMSIKSAWQKILYIRTFPGTFYFFKKSSWQKVSFTSALPQALIISSAVSSLVTLHLWRKKCLGIKVPGMQHCSIPASRILRRPAARCKSAAGFNATKVTWQQRRKSVQSVSHWTLSSKERSLDWPQKAWMEYSFSYLKTLIGHNDII